MIQSINSKETYTCGTRKDIICTNEEIKYGNMIKQDKIGEVCWC